MCALCPEEECHREGQEPVRRREPLHREGGQPVRREESQALRREESESVRGEESESVRGEESKSVRGEKSLRRQESVRGEKPLCSEEIGAASRCVQVPGWRPGISPLRWAGANPAIRWQERHRRRGRPCREYLVRNLKPCTVRAQRPSNACAY